MALPQQYAKELLTEEEYVAFLDSAEASRADVRGWEFVPAGARTMAGAPLGVIRAMATGTLEHATAVQNVGTALDNALRGRDCRTVGPSLTVHCPSGRNAIPDVQVFCGPPVHHRVNNRERRDIITNPLLIVEVLSDDTEAEDRGAKWVGYQSIPTLMDYLLVDPRARRVELFHRDDYLGLWSYARFESPEDVVLLPSVGVTLPLSEIYRNIVPEGRL